MTDPNVVVQQFSGKVHVFTPGGSEQDSKYFRWQIEQFDDGTWSGWDLERIHECTRTASTAFSIGNNLTDSGQHWPAIKEDGQDFIGGTVHGHEIGSSATIEVDASPQSIDGTTTYQGDSVTFTKTSTLYSKADGTTQIFTLTTEMTFTASDVVVTSTITALTSVDIITAYLAMWSFSKYLNATEAHGLVFDHYYASPDYVDGVVGTEGSPLTASRFLMVGDDSGIRADIEVTSGWADSERDSFVQLASSSSKAYFSPVGINRAVPLSMVVDDAITMTTRYKLTSSN